MSVLTAITGLILPDPDRKKRLGHKRSNRWDDVRRAFLKSYPTCAACGRKTDLNVHHVEPFQVRPDLELDPRNLITLCEYDTCNCHLWIGHAGRWDAWNPQVREDAAHFAAMLLQRKVA